jgi:acyl-CoA synthetase (AMP-forming)/AMP-acid ligase II
MELMKQLIEKMNLTEITIGYGFTEASPLITQTRYDDSLEIKVGTVGKAHQNVKVKIVDPETKKEIPLDTAGELCAYGYNAMKGYYKMPDKTKEVIDAEGWMHTGDLAAMDKNGVCRIVGRIKDMIIRGGENIYPAETEEFFHKKKTLVIPDFVANAGGVISSYVEYIGGNKERMFKLVKEKVINNTKLVLNQAKNKGLSPRECAMKIARDRVLKKCRICRI